jgi:hypothetical protein
MGQRVIFMKLMLDCCDHENKIQGCLQVYHQAHKLCVRLDEEAIRMVLAEGLSMDKMITMPANGTVEGAQNY